MYVITDNGIPVAAFYEYHAAEHYVHINHLSIDDIYRVEVH